MKNDLLKLIQWFCRKLTYNDLASVVPVLQEVLGGSRKDVDLKPDEERPPNYRQFRVDPTLPLTEPLEPKEEPPDWKKIQKEHERITGKRIAIELNMEIIPRSEHPSTMLAQNDTVEIVNAIGGG
mgnify:CR=1 FL=1